MKTIIHKTKGDVDQCKNRSYYRPPMKHLLQSEVTTQSCLKSKPTKLVQQLISPRNRKGPLRVRNKLQKDGSRKKQASTPSECYLWQIIERSESFNWFLQRQAEKINGVFPIGEDLEEPIPKVKARRFRFYWEIRLLCNHWRNRWKLNKQRRRWSYPFLLEF